MKNNLCHFVLTKASSKSKRRLWFKVQTSLLKKSSDRIRRSRLSVYVMPSCVCSGPSQLFFGSCSKILTIYLKHNKIALEINSSTYICLTFFYKL